MRTALVTGSAGFVGSHMVAELKARGYGVEHFDIRGEPPREAKERLRRLGGYPAGDIPDFDLLVHCAYHVGGRKGIEHNRSALALNLALDSSVFAFAANSGHVGRVLYFSSSAIYPVSMQGPGADRLTEGMAGPGSHFPDQPDADYGFAKLAGERMAANCRELGTPVTVIRPFSGYGEDQSLDYPFPSIVKRAVDGASPFPIWGDASQTRDWVHIDDVVRGSLAVTHLQGGMDPETAAQPVNLCTGAGSTLRQLASLAWVAADQRDAMSIKVDTSAPMGVHTRVGSDTLLRNYYNYSVSLEDGVERAVRRFRDGR
jgi:nucleoside-diphosphate-sugar epimerase